MTLPVVGIILAIVIVIYVIVVVAIIAVFIVVVVILVGVIIIWSDSAFFNILCSELALREVGDKTGITVTRCELKSLSNVRSRIYQM